MNIRPLNSCVAYYSVWGGMVYLENDSGSAWLRSCREVSGTAEQPVHIDHGGKRGVDERERACFHDRIYVQRGLRRSEDVYLWASDNAGANTGWQKRGTWQWGQHRC